LLLQSLLANLLLDFDCHKDQTTIHGVLEFFNQIEHQVSNQWFNSQYSNLFVSSRAVNSVTFTTNRFRTTATAGNVNPFFAGGAAIDVAA
jgi:hypothetical protein